MELVHEYPDLTVRLTLYHTRILRGEPRALEHNDLKWITPQQIDTLDFFPADVQILEKLKQMDIPE